MSVDPLPTMPLSGEMWVNIGHPVSPDKMALAVGGPGNTLSDRGMYWDNSGKNGLAHPSAGPTCRDARREVVRRLGRRDD